MHRSLVPIMCSGGLVNDYSCCCNSFSPLAPRSRNKSMTIFAWCSRHCDVLFVLCLWALAQRTQTHSGFSLSSHVMGVLACKGPCICRNLLASFGLEHPLAHLPARARDIAQLYAHSQKVDIRRCICHKFNVANTQHVFSTLSRAPFPATLGLRIVSGVSCPERGDVLGRIVQDSGANTANESPCSA